MLRLSFAKYPMSSIQTNILESGLLLNSTLDIKSLVKRSESLTRDRKCWSIGVEINSPTGQNLYCLFNNSNFRIIDQYQIRTVSEGGGCCSPTSKLQKYYCLVYICEKHANNKILPKIKIFQLI